MTEVKEKRKPVKLPKELYNAEDKEWFLKDFGYDENTQITYRRLLAKEGDYERKLDKDLAKFIGQINSLCDKWDR
jgi:hypothetical protein